MELVKTVGTTLEHFEDYNGKLVNLIKNVRSGWPIKTVNDGERTKDPILWTRAKNANANLKIIRRFLLHMLDDVDDLTNAVSKIKTVELERRITHEVEYSRNLGDNVSHLQNVVVNVKNKLSDCRDDVVSEKKKNRQPSMSSNSSTSESLSSSSPRKKGISFAELGRNYRGRPKSQTPDSPKSKKRAKRA
jgi:hypothetical protein